MKLHNTITRTQYQVRQRHQSKENRSANEKKMKSVNKKSTNQKREKRNHKKIDKTSAVHCYHI